MNDLDVWLDKHSIELEKWEKDELLDLIHSYEQKAKEQGVNDVLDRMVEDGLVAKEESRYYGYRISELKEEK